MIEYRNFKLVQSEGSCRGQCKCGLNDKICLGRVENMMEKRENAADQHILLHPQYL